MKGNKEFVDRLVMDNILLGKAMKEQEIKIGIINARNKELINLVRVLKNMLINLDPSMKDCCNFLDI